MFKSIIILSVTALLVVTLTVASCGGVTTSTIKLTETIDNFYSAVLLLENHATSVKIGLKHVDC